MGQGVLGVSNALLHRIARLTGTPVYVYVADAIREQWKELTRALSAVPHRIHYSVKANSNHHILRLVRELGGGADIVSGGERRRVELAGFAPADIVFSGVGKSRTELTDAVESGVGLINVESVEEFAMLSTLVHLAQEPVGVGIRINPDVTTNTHPYTQTGETGMKFGVPMDRARELAQRMAETPGVTLTCVGMHIGSQVTDAASYRVGAEKLVDLVRDFRASGIDTLTAVDVGGGMAIRYTDEVPLSVDAFAGAVIPVHQATGLELLIEPGRFLVGNAGALLTRVLYRKHSGGKDFVIVDAGMNDLVRPALYGARHPIDVIDPGNAEGYAAGPVDIVGPICETGDFIARDYPLPQTGPDALLAVLGAGAYGFSMSSTYNSRPRAPEVLVDGGQFAVVRNRESVESLYGDEVVHPAWLPATAGAAPNAVTE